MTQGAPEYRRPWAKFGNAFGVGVEKRSAYSKIMSSTVRPPGIIGSTCST